VNVQNSIYEVASYKSWDADDKCTAMVPRTGNWPTKRLIKSHSFAREVGRCHPNRNASIGGTYREKSVSVSKRLNLRWHILKKEEGNSYPPQL
jgi:hypothetical protein